MKCLPDKQACIFMALIKPMEVSSVKLMEINFSKDLF